MNIPIPTSPQKNQILYYPLLFRIVRSLRNFECLIQHGINVREFPSRKKIVLKSLLEELCLMPKDSSFPLYRESLKYNNKFNRFLHLGRISFFSLSPPFTTILDFNFQWTVFKIASFIYPFIICYFYFACLIPSSAASFF